MASQGKSAARPVDDPFALWLGSVMLVALVLFGGASRADAMSQPIIRIISVAVAGCCLFRMRSENWQTISLPTKFLGAFAGLCLLQLIPIPSELWARVPGNARIAEAMADASMVDVWRPWSLTPDRTLNVLLACLPPFATLCALSLQSQRKLDFIPAVLLGAVSLSAFLGLMQVYGGGPYFYRITNSGNAVGIFANRNHAALLLAMGLPLIAFLILRILRAGRPSALTVVSAGAGALLLLALLLTNGSRAGLLVGLVGLMGGAWMILRSRVLQFDRVKTTLLIALIALGVAALSLLFWLADRSLTFSRMTESPDEIAELRILALPHIWQMIRDFFPFGAGMGSFEAVFKMIEPDRLVSPVYLNHAHNDYLELVGDAGILGAALLGSFVFVLGRRITASLRRERENPMTFMAVVMLAQLAVASGLDYPIRTPFMSAMLCYLSFIVLAAGVTDRETSDNASSATDTRKVRQ